MEFVSSGGRAGQLHQHSAVHGAHHGACHKTESVEAEDEHQRVPVPREQTHSSEHERHPDGPRESIGPQPPAGVRNETTQNEPLSEAEDRPCAP